MPKATSKQPLKQNDKVLTTDESGRAFVGTVVAVEKDLVTVWPDQLPQLPIGVKSANCVPVTELV
jgi:hypothetical protein